MTNDEMVIVRRIQGLAGSAKSCYDHHGAITSVLEEIVELAVTLRGSSESMIADTAKAIRKRVPR